MQIEIDTGSRLDQSGDTTFAFSNDIQKAILLKQAVRDECLERLNGKKLGKEIRLFAACIFFLIKDHLPEIEEIIIDVEYPSHEEQIKWIFLNILKKHFPYHNRRLVIRFDNIGKNSYAHRVAWETLRKIKDPDKIISASEILSILLK
jgi:hypothetical protein